MSRGGFFFAADFVRLGSSNGQNASLTCLSAICVLHAQVRFSSTWRNRIEHMSGNKIQRLENPTIVLTSSGSRNLGPSLMAGGSKPCAQAEFVRTQVCFVDIRSRLERECCNDRVRGA